MNDAPIRLEVRKERGVTVEWADGRVSFFPVSHLRRMSPSADARQTRKELTSNPLTVLPASTARASRPGPLVIVDAELVGNYALRIRFSDGHHTGIYSWVYLREIDPGAQKGSSAGG
ncbi:MAG: DUF971 domain-containing protein [Phycisphaeraceae bacterium]|nr:DUF971 domain-containing protein [Phycisphaeraceae bacterium]